MLIHKDRKCLLGYKLKRLKKSAFYVNFFSFLAKQLQSRMKKLKLSNSDEVDFTSLPSEILFLVLQFLDLKDKQNIRRTSKKLFDLVNCWYDHQSEYEIITNSIFLGLSAFTTTTPNVCAAYHPVPHITTPGEKFEGW